MATRPLSPANSEEPFFKKRKNNKAQASKAASTTISNDETAEHSDTVPKSTTPTITSQQADFASSTKSQLSQSQKESQLMSSIPLSKLYTLKETQSQPKEAQFTITKNTKMSLRVDQIFKSLKKQSETSQHRTLIMAHGPHLARLISIVEILKCKLSEDLKDAKWVQYNRLEKMEVSYDVNDLKSKSLKIPILYVMFACVNDNVEDAVKDIKDWTKQEVK
ncbi:hypothetical protein WICPIJ_009895 [Wickerhamomyces pijperi]|uniref:DNA/RNA-binding protein Alba-like domain-containing protein n=1 Tax=Wickerhamomyces pijperi TaxID=599730 RepID=A0A9P8PJU0_WICPI|nr:hypothetical protein WICPIJ_009895 [Wickerhamomyces pijperi]